MTSAAIMQPVYLPWLGYFEQMAICDHFIFLDDAQYTKQDWRNRNRIRTKDGWMWLTVPVRKDSLKARLCDIHISDHGHWQRTQLRAITQNYGRASFFQDIFPVLEKAFAAAPEHLTDLTMGLVQDFAPLLGIKTPIVKASSIPSTTSKTIDPVARIGELCQHVGADIFYTGPAAQSYMADDALAGQGIKPVFQDYQHPVYTQAHTGFESHMAVIDLLMNHGPASREILLSSPRPAILGA